MHKVLEAVEEENDSKKSLGTIRAKGCMAALFLNVEVVDVPRVDFFSGSRVVLSSLQLPR